jgi:type II secretory pathway component PulF
MPWFAYKALEAGGAVNAGRLEAGGRQEAMRLLETRGLTPVRLDEVTGDGTAREGGIAAWWRRDKVSFGALEDFTRSLSSLLAAGVPLSRALTILSEEATEPAARRAWSEVHDLVIDGVALADAMRRAPQIFPQVYVAMIEAGEAGGFLDVVLGQIADFQSRQRELRATVMAALMYPAVLLLLASAVLIFLLVFFIPRFEVLFEGFDAALPLLTRAIVNISNWLRQFGLLAAGGLVIVLHLARNWLRTGPGRQRWERALLAAPLVGPLAARLSMSRFCRMLGTLLAAGVPLMNGLQVAGRSLGFQMLIDLVADAAERIRQGQTLAASLAENRVLFPGSSLEMISVAEESGRLEQELIRQAEVTERSLDRELKTAVSLAEPLLLFLIAGFIGLIFVGMVIPIFSIQDYIQ